jgi:hypothetical protein
LSLTSILTKLKTAIKEPDDFTTTQFKNFLINASQYGEYNTKQLRGWALKFNLSRREFADLATAYLYADKTENPQLTRHRNNYGLEVVICGTCTHLEWNLYQRPGLVNGTRVKVCTVCVQERFFGCEHCGAFKHRDERQELRSVNICKTCWVIVGPTWLICTGCGGEYRMSGAREYHHYGAFWVDSPGREEVSRTTEGALFYCTRCRAPERSKCKPRVPEFDFPVLCLGPDEKIHSDEIKELTVGGGDVTEGGLTAIRNLVSIRTAGPVIDPTTGRQQGIHLHELMTDDFDRRWQTVEGNMPKRLAKLLFVQRHMKLTEELMSEIGNLAKQYTSRPGTHRVSLTRNLNGSKSEFVNENSCWWTDYWYSRCTLKSMGGLGVRLWETRPTFNARGTVSGSKEFPIGRAWMIPLELLAASNPEKYTWGRFKPDAPLPAPAYIIFNAYDGRSSKDRAELFDFARIIAQMTGKSYRKVHFRAPHMYLNGTALGSDGDPKGVLIAEQSVCSEFATVEISQVPNQCSCPGHPGLTPSRTR